jgi:hypothetical protein
MLRSFLISPLPFVALLVLMPGFSIASNDSPEGDSIALPPIVRKQASVNKKYEFLVTSPNNWQTSIAHGKLIESSGGVRKTVWKGMLPQEYGPRFILAGSSGSVLLLDSWLNIKPSEAILIIHAGKRTITAFSYEDIMHAIKLSASTLTAKARFGSWWIAGQPFLDKSGHIASIPVGGKILLVDLDRGKISLRR